MNAYLGTISTDFTPTYHAQLRMAQRNISQDDVAFVLEHGQCIHRAGAIFFYLRRRDIAKRFWDHYARLEGTAVVVTRRTGQILTIYRNRENGLRHIKRKVGWDCKSH